MATIENRKRKTIEEENETKLSNFGEKRQRYSTKLKIRATNADLLSSVFKETSGMDDITYITLTFKEEGILFTTCRKNKDSQFTLAFINNTMFECYEVNPFSVTVLPSDLQKVSQVIGKWEYMDIIHDETDATIQFSCKSEKYNNGIKLAPQGIDLEDIDENLNKVIKNASASIRIPLGDLRTLVNDLVYAGIKDAGDTTISIKKNNTLEISVLNSLGNVQVQNKIYNIPEDKSNLEGIHSISINVNFKLIKHYISFQKGFSDVFISFNPNQPQYLVFYIKLNDSSPPGHYTLITTGIVSKLD